MGGEFLAAENGTYRDLFIEKMTISFSGGLSLLSSLIFFIHIIVYSIKIDFVNILKNMLLLYYIIMLMYMTLIL